MEEFRFNFEKLIVWQKARTLAKEVYTATENFPAEERFRLADQIRRAGISVASNIAEGASRRSFKDQERFLEIAYGSLMEVCCQMQLSVDLGFISESDFARFRERFREISRLLVALKTSLANRQ